MPVVSTGSMSDMCRYIYLPGNHTQTPWLNQVLHSVTSNCYSPLYLGLPSASTFELSRMTLHTSATLFPVIQHCLNLAVVQLISIHTSVVSTLSVISNKVTRVSNLLAKRTRASAMPMWENNSSQQSAQWSDPSVAITAPGHTCRPVVVHFQNKPIWNHTVNEYRTCVGVDCRALLCGLPSLGNPQRRKQFQKTLWCRESKARHYVKSSAFAWFNQANQHDVTKLSVIKKRYLFSFAFLTLSSVVWWICDSLNCMQIIYLLCFK